MAKKPKIDPNSFQAQYSVGEIYGSPSIMRVRQEAEREDRENGRWAYTGYGISASELGSECDRKIFLDLRWATASDTNQYSSIKIFERGNWEEDRTIEDLKRVPEFTVNDVDPATGRQFVISLADGLIRGRTDGEIYGLLESQKVHVMEIKSMKDADWKVTFKKGLRKANEKHWYQLQAGMKERGIDRGLYIYRNKATEELGMERVKLDDKIMDLAIDRVTSISQMNDMPAGSFDEKKTIDTIKHPSPCAFCKHNDFCYTPKFAPRTCRSCIHATIITDGQVRCARFDRDIHPKNQKDDCPMHLYLPTLVPGELIGADEEAGTVAYTLPDGSTWIDGGVE